MSNLTSYFFFFSKASHSELNVTFPNTVKKQHLRAPFEEVLWLQNVDIGNAKQI